MTWGQAHNHDSTRHMSPSKELGIGLGGVSLSVALDMTPMVRYMGSHTQLSPLLSPLLFGERQVC